MKFIVTGTRRDSGQGVRGTIDAPNPAAAQQAAEKRGITVSSVEPMGGQGHAAHPPAPQHYAPPPQQYAPPPAAYPGQGYAPQPAYPPQPQYVAPDAYGAPGPVPPHGYVPPQAARSRKRPMLIIAIVLLMIGLGVAGWMIFGRSSDALDDYMVYVPDDATRIGLVDATRFRDSQVFKDELARGRGPKSGKTKPEDLDVELDVRTGDKSWSIVKLNKEYAPSDLIETMSVSTDGDTPSSGIKTSTLEGFDAASWEGGFLGNNFVVKLDKHLFIRTDSEATAKKVIQMHKDGKRPTLSPTMKDGLDRVRGHHIIEVRHDKDARGDSHVAKAEGKSIGDKLEAKTVWVYATDAAAQKAVDARRKDLEDAKQHAEAKVKPLLNNVNISTDGPRMVLTASWNYADVKAAAGDKSPMSMLPDVD